jgi:putative thioredoxin
MAAAPESTRLVFDTGADSFVADVIERSRHVTVAVDFWAAWCGPCRALGPLLEQLVKMYGGRLALARVNTDEEPGLSAQFGIRSIPDVRIFRDGRMVDGFVGAHPLERLKQLFDKHVPPPPDSPPLRAKDLIAAGKVAEARDVLQEYLARAADDTAARLLLADVQARLGEIDEAGRLLDALPLDQQMSAPAEAVRARIHFTRHAAAESEVPALRKAAEAGKAPPHDILRLAAFEVLRGDAQRGLDLLLALIQRNPRDDFARSNLRHAFALLGDEDPRVGPARRRMAMLLH